MTVKTTLIILFKIEIIFIFLFNLCYTIGVAIWGYSRNVGDLWETFFSVLLAITSCAVCILIYMIVKSRFGFLSMSGLFAYWWVVPAGHLLNSVIYAVFPGTYITMGLCFLFFGLNAVFGILLFFTETFRLGLTHHSIFWGPWFTKFSQIRSIKSMEGNKLKVIAHGAVILVVLVILMLPGIFQYTNTYNNLIPITIKLQSNYNATFNFWTTPNINGTNNDVSMFNGTPIYPTAVLNALNKPYVNLDLTFGELSNSDIPTILAWQNACPNATYRITITPSLGLMYLYDYVKNATDIMMSLEANGSVPGWRGFAFDIEGQP